MSTFTVPELIERSGKLLKQYANAVRGTDLLYEIAPLVVELRSRFHLEDERTDWSGRSPGYRAAIREVYSLGEIPKESLDTVQAALRYHVGNLLRDRAPADELEGVGLIKLSPKKRLALRREAFRLGVNEIMKLWSKHQAHCTSGCGCFTRAVEAGNAELWK